LYYNTTGQYNVAIGLQALQANTTASNNTAVGYQAGYSNTTGVNNVFIGNITGYSATTGAGNTFVGLQAGYSVTTGIQNTFVGPFASGVGGAGDAITTGSKNTIIGRYSGNQGGLDIRTASNYIVLSDGDGNPRIVVNNNGAVAFGTVTPYGSFIQTINGNANTQGLVALQDTSTTYGTSTQYLTFLNSTNGTAGSIQHTAVTTVAYATSSDKRLKENIVNAPNALDKVVNLPVRSYDWKEDNLHVEYGFVAQELAEIYSEPVGVGGDDVKKDPWNIEYGRLTPILVKAIQELKTIVDTQAAEIAELKAKVA
jgi:hypothetical protein